ncbi:2,5-didehydrogluconate reductase B [Saccharospirillum sp. MSK14-1]|uniref:2,5-didehydrogluconate reductase DkgB n=1 Tax=Saccharospirillum sp. MSK14-1 TaxID=1897632 RepID=UPI000D35AEAF|nr:2,5-didehydrogluconate reductase DkgB [Saccharospirillum sp. MSK14-1]PTY35775.1 2,5-didehydrogluconate reductase B [Saccharospirillum sp. MSK14-1]
MSYSTLPMPGMGTFRLKGEHARDAVLTALDLGFRHIDTAVMYDNETAVGEAIARSDSGRDKVFLTTKVWHTDLAPESLQASIDGSLQRLGTDHVDLLLIHWPSPNQSVPMSESLNALKEVRDTGKARHIGVSNFTIAQIDEAIDVLGEGELLTNQIEVHPFLQNHAVVEHCQQRGITVTGYMPLAVGRVLEDPTLMAIADEHQLTPAQIALAWLRQRNVVPIPASSKAQHLQANLDAMTVELNDEDMQRIAQLDRHQRFADPDFAPKWD